MLKGMMDGTLGSATMMVFEPFEDEPDKRFCEKRIGHERSKGAYAWRSLLDTGVKIAFGTDYTVEPLEPLEGLYAGVTRKDRAGEPGPGWFLDQILTMEETIELYTPGSAYAQFMENRKGSIKEGYLADMVIYDKDLMTIPHEEIMKALVDYTTEYFLKFNSKYCKFSIIGGRLYL